MLFRSWEVVEGIGIEQETVIEMIIEGTRQTDEADFEMTASNLSCPLLAPRMTVNEEQRKWSDAEEGEEFIEVMCWTVDMEKADELSYIQKVEGINFNSCNSSNNIKTKDIVDVDVDVDDCAVARDHIVSTTDKTDSCHDNSKVNKMDTVAPVNSKFFKQSTKAAITNKSVLPVRSAGRGSGDGKEDRDKEEEEEEGNGFYGCSKPNSIATMVCDYGRKVGNSSRTVADSTYDRYTYKANTHLNTSSHTNETRINKCVKGSSDSSRIGGKRDISQIRNSVVSNKMATFLR